MSQSVLDLADVKSRMLVIRNQPVLLDRDVAELYGVETRVVNQAVKRNLERFPEGYILELTSDECPRSQILTLNGKPLPLLLSPASTPPVRRPRQRPSPISGHGACRPVSPRAEDRSNGIQDVARAHPLSEQQSARDLSSRADRRPPFIVITARP